MEKSALYASLSHLPTLSKDAKKKLEIKLINVGKNAECESEPSSPCYNADQREPSSPDSGFSSDDGVTDVLTARHKLDLRTRILPSALKCQSKRCPKKVRFADAFGLDLEKREYFSQDEAIIFSPPSPTHTGFSRLVLSNFIYRSESEYNQRTRDARVCVTAVRASGTTMYGQINVFNTAFDKEVVVRYTVSNWLAYEDVLAIFSHRVSGTDDIDAFNFSLFIPNYVKRGRCEFCVRFSVSGSEFWDNNNGKNYKVDMLEDNYTSKQHTMRKTSQSRLSLCHELPHNFRLWGKICDNSDNDTTKIYTPRRRLEY